MGIFGKHFGDQNLGFILVISCTFTSEFLRLQLCNHGAIVVEFAGILEKLSAHIPHKLFPQKQHTFYKISKGFEQKLASFGLKSPLKDQMGNQMDTAKLI